MQGFGRRERGKALSFHPFWWWGTMKFMAWTRVSLVINRVIRQYINAPDYMINMWLSPECERGDNHNICSVISPGQGCLMGSSFNFSSNHWNFHFMFAVPFLLQMSWHYNHESWPFTVSLLLLSLPATYVTVFSVWFILLSMLILGNLWCHLPLWLCIEHSIW